MEEQRLIRVEEQLKMVAEDVGEVKGALIDIAKSLKLLAVLEEKHNTVTDALKRAFTTIDKHTEKFEEIDKALPNLKLASSWIFAAILFTMGILGTAAIVTVLKGLLK